MGNADAVGCKQFGLRIVQEAAVSEPTVVLVPVDLPARRV